ncbi:hypothetical protein A0J48_026000, partial [Sphaerospermopsis aphanizomenoides BCCUSP55]|nr:hypothetical protein [Sphaerospermopsis aphanizomenoides BCCUSP55]
MNTLLNDALTLTYNQLSAFSGLDNFWQVFDTAFGTQYDHSAAEILRLQWQAGDFSQLPEIEIIDSSILGGANGAYASSKNKIYLSNTFVANATSAAISAVLLEEIGHFVDDQINLTDSAGDEGAIFAELVQGKSLDASTLEALQAEDDSAIINLDGERVLVEQANYTGTNGNDIITGTSGNDTISSLRGQDYVDGGEGDDLLIIDYSSNTYAGTTTYLAGIDSYIYDNGVGGWNGYLYAYINSSGNYDAVDFYDIERFQITGTNFNDTFDIGGDEAFTIDGGAGTDTINYADFSSFTTNLTVNNSGGTFTESNGTVVKNVERFANLTTGTGNDTITFTGRFDESIDTGDGNDSISVGQGYDYVYGGEGDDLLIIDYSSNTYAGTTTYLAGIDSYIYDNGVGGWNGYLYAYINSSGNY